MGEYDNEGEHECVSVSVSVTSVATTPPPFGVVRASSED